MWPRMAASVRWKIGRVASRVLAARKPCSTASRFRYRRTTCRGDSLLLVRRAPSSCWLLDERVGKPRAMLARRSSRGSDSADVCPHLERTHPGGAVVVGGDVVAAEVEKVADLTVDGEETLRLPGRLEALHLP